MITIEAVTSTSQLEQIGELFREYQISLGIDLCFQDFERELANLPGKYAPPQGRLYLALCDGMPAGSIALRPHQDDQCEMKRLYVRPAFRGRQIARLLTRQIIADAQAIGYRQMVLDTLSTMTAACALYQSLGFQPIPPYCFNPLAHVCYLGLDLTLQDKESRQ
ncbi:GNAT family N-acetyltransferase [Heliophilum fasciatum]|uniref:Acetyltransferase (GNAT) family protein n=1 Tax=Heliophilum fasciatum TaxID=35700 RepID=A0A4R2S170_9FIRM|nr:GNAT family N-acetyltransferase [Heliophilum fasciatum]MCW2276672.1 ribosomal protein S18 acetylase RimI-like enzyme [Heliophilum fasciatum]TCP68947.1 acetyltransferase (GNAT) family protein [Heliophilum fasciatum]